MEFDESFLKKLEYLYVVAKKVFVGRIRAERRSRKTGSPIIAITPPATIYGISIGRSTAASTSCSCDYSRKRKIYTSI
jgi:hypothetical protein